MFGMEGVNVSGSVWEEPGATVKGVVGPKSCPVTVAVSAPRVDEAIRHA